MVGGFLVVALAVGRAMVAWLWCFRSCRLGVSLGRGLVDWNQVALELWAGVESWVEVRSLAC